MFSICYGSQKREDRIREMAESDVSTAVILASVHFEWMIKRSILKLSSSPTKALREKLQDVYSIKERNGKKGYKAIWKEEIANKYKKNSGLGSVIGNLHVLDKDAFAIRGEVVHGNGTVSKKQGIEAVEQYLTATQKLRAFAQSKGIDLDERLASRR